MRGNKAFQVLQTFSSWEFRSLDAYIRSPFFTRQTMILQLWEIVRPLAPDFSAPVLDRQQLFQRLWPDQAYAENQLRYLLTDFTRLLEGFLAYKHWQEAPGRFQQELIEAYAQRGLHKYCSQKSQQLAQILSQATGLSTQRLHQRFQLEEVRYLATESKRQDSYPVQSVLLSLDQMAIAYHLKYACEGINRTRIFQEAGKSSLTPFLLQALKSDPSLRTPLSDYYQQVYYMLTETAGDVHYYALKESLWAETQLAQEERVPLYFFALNYCIRQVNQGKEDFRTESFALYRKALENDILYDERGYLAENHFKNLIALGTRLKAYTWTKSFIETYQFKLEEEIRPNAYCYNLAYLSFAQQDYQQVLQLLQQVEFTQVFYQLGAKTLLLRTYFETQEFEALEYLLKSFRTYLRRQKALSDTQRNLYLNLCQVVQMLNRYVLGEKVSLEQIKQILTEKPQIAAREWLWEKVGVLG